MDVRQLEYLVESVSKGSFAAAGRTLFVSPQAVSRGVADLEAELGVALLLKKSNGIAPTSLGAALAERAAEVLRSMDDLKRMAKAGVEDGEVRGRVVLAIGASILDGEYFQAARLKALRDAYPGIDLSIVFYESGMCFTAVERGIADAAIILGRADNPGIHCVKVSELPSYIAMSACNALADRPSVSAKDLEGANMASPHDFRHTYLAFKRYLENRGVRVRMHNIEARAESYRTFMEDGSGVVLVSEGFSRMGDRYPNCICIPLDEDDPFTVPVCFVRKKETNPKAVCRLEHCVVNGCACG